MNNNNNNITIYGYINKLKQIKQGEFDGVVSAFYKVPYDWMENIVLCLGYKSINEFLDTYTYDNTDEIIDFAIEDRMLIECGAEEKFLETMAEWCPHCCAEVELPMIFKKHICPNCKFEIIPCAQCEKQNCGHCPLAS
ncbi:hypothetical protein ACQRXC_28965 (plasmid) [Niallia taxi]|uniref:hypothetical protein n=2 Tax=Bacteria TaxID=2 RepID=UPI0015F3B329|nr:hypothetical protein [Niallia taxi]MED4057202.1 hypothetical protein [Niallia taxi]MED4122110.1 hypothetical protein [Niallia taxi]